METTQKNQVVLTKLNQLQIHLRYKAINHKGECDEYKTVTGFSNFRVAGRRNLFLLSG
jgi:hypothetical protein